MLGSIIRSFTTLFLRRERLSSRPIHKRVRQARLSFTTSSSTSSANRPSALYGFAHASQRWVQQSKHAAAPEQPNPSSLWVLSWNIDFMEHYILERWKVALDYIETLEPSPAILLFQETHTAALPVVLEHPFVRKSFLLSNVSPPPGSQYSTLILVSRALAARCKSVTATRVPYDALTKMQRDCLYVELDIQSRRFRIATTHLESLHGFGTIARPKQLALAANLLKAEGIDGGLVAGDMNCIGQNEKDLPERTGLVDAWTSIKAKPTSEDEEKDAHTWGYQPPSQYAPLRMDKILTVGKLEAVNIQRVGVGLEAQVAPDDDDDDKVWVSDHYGLLAEIVLR